ncbi:hypothetical protein DSM104299_00254 [Baekduia alba]|uniref:hypothetical protein n=1 Tax=Baekduia alba TaxID=2997333 RepID=UPI002340FE90|nr:hypothetical protein [Baekduia alba]WCB91583.1 hypothetical protein DSM104299_00254 [Baekduia alba]
MSATDDAARRAAFEDECLRATRAILADGTPLRGEMEGHGRHLRSFTLHRANDAAEIVAELILADGTPLTERYDIWTYDTPPDLDEPGAARQAASMIAAGITNL